VWEMPQCCDRKPADCGQPSGEGAADDIHSDCGRLTQDAKKRGWIRGWRHQSQRCVRPARAVIHTVRDGKNLVSDNMRLRSARDGERSESPELSRSRIDVHKGE